MNDELNIDVKTLNPFRRFIYTIGALPSSYLISMTYEEQLIWFCNYLEKTVIPAINNNGLAVEELQAKYIELKSYVDNYFEDLDIQTEINNKLDEMADSGELTDIIAQYLQLAGVLAYDTISDLENATNVANGSICVVLGETNYNDGKIAFYKVRNLTIDDTIDGFNIVGINNTLVGERLPNYYINQINNEIATINQKIAKKYMLVIGDSFSTTYYNPANTAWYTLVAKRLNLEVKNFSKNSAGFVHVGDNSKTFNILVNDAIADTSFNNNDVELVVVYGGLNDMNSTDIGSFDTNVRTVFTNIDGNFPNAKIVFMGINTWAGGLYVGSSNNTTLNYYRSACRNIADLGIIFVNSTLWLLLDSDNCYDPQTTHPNALGNQITATNLLNALYGNNFITTKNAYQITQSSFSTGSGTVHIRLWNNAIILEGQITTSADGYAEFTMPKNLSSNGFLTNGALATNNVNVSGWLQFTGQTVKLNGQASRTYYFNVMYPII